MRFVDLRCASPQWDLEQNELARPTDSIVEVTRDILIEVYGSDRICSLTAQTKCALESVKDVCCGLKKVLQLHKVDCRFLDLSLVEKPLRRSVQACKRWF